MLPIQNLTILTSFTILGIAFILIIRHQKKDGGEFLGSLTTGKKMFILGKIGIFGSWLLFMIKAIAGNHISFMYIPTKIRWIAILLLMMGAAMIILSFITLGKATKMGIPSEDTKLKTNGLYRFSRNPLYVGVFIICIASNIYFPSLINLGLACMGIYVHHRMVLEEEEFLTKRFGDEWVNYTRKVRRYL